MTHPKVSPNRISVRNNWSRDELIAAFNLYCKTPFGRITSTNKDVIDLANIIHRSPSAVALKLANYARLDPTLKERNIAGMSHGSKGETEIWHEFNHNWEELAFQSELILAEYKNQNIEDSSNISKLDLPQEGKEREVIVKARVNQQFFRKTILASYEYRCCITGLSVPELLVASHIVPWAINKDNRMNPCNGLCLNALHDAAFDRGLITITTDYRLLVSNSLKTYHPHNLFILYDNTKVTLPQRFIPSREFIEYHNKNIFIDR